MYFAASLTLDSISHILNCSFARWMIFWFHLTLLPFSLRSHLLFFHLFENFKAFILMFSLNQIDVYTNNYCDFESNGIEWCHWTNVYVLCRVHCTPSKWINQWSIVVYYFLLYCLLSIDWRVNGWSANEWANNFFFNGFLFR